MFQPTNLPIHQPSHRTKHQPMGGGVSRHISNLDSDLKYFDSYCIFTDLGGSPPGGWVGVSVGLRLGVGWGHTCMYTCIHAHVHA